MADALSSPLQNHAVQQFQGIFSDMWLVSATAAFTGAAAAAESSVSVSTITGIDVSKGDMVIAFSFDADCEPNIFFWQAFVTADSTIELCYTNASGSSDIPAPTKVWFLVGRPAWNPGT